MSQLFAMLCEACEKAGGTKERSAETKKRNTDLLLWSYIDSCDTIPGISGEFSSFALLLYLFLKNEWFCSDVTWRSFFNFFFFLIIHQKVIVSNTSAWLDFFSLFIEYDSPLKYLWINRTRQNFNKFKCHLESP